MKLLFVLTYYYPHWTGLTQYAKLLAEGLVGRGHEVEVLTTRHLDYLMMEEEINRVKIRRVPIIGKLSRTMISPQLYVEIIEKVNRVDRVVVFLPFGEALWVSIVARLLRKKVWYVYNGDLVLTKSKINKFIEIIFEISTKWAIKYSEGVIVNTTDYATHSKVLANIPEKWIEVVPPLINLDSNISERIRINNLIGKRKLTIGFSGRWVEEKGFDILLKSIPAVLKNIDDVKFVFAGETNISYEKTFIKDQRLVDRINKSIVFLGKLERNSMADFYKNIDVLVVPSRSDFFPFVQVEAMLAGKPVVVSDIPGARWLVKTTGMGVVVPKENPSKLAEAIIFVCTNLDKFKKKHAMVKKIFNQKILLDTYEQIFKLC